MEPKDHPLKDITVDQINARYRQGYLTVGERNELIRQRAGLSLEDTIEKQGILLTYFTETVKHAQENWDDFVKSAMEHDPTKSEWENIKLPGQLIADQIGMLLAPLQAFQEVNGATVRRWAEDAGASPGLAAVFATIADVGSAFVPVGRAYQSFARGVQKLAGKGVAKTAGAGAEAATKAAGTATAKPGATPVTLYRGGENLDPKKLTDYGASFTTNKKVAMAYSADIPGGGVQAFTLKEGAKVANFDDLLKQYAEEIGTTPDELLKYPNVLQEGIAQFAKKRGFDAVDMTRHVTKVPTGASQIDTKLAAGTGIKESEMRVLNPDALIPVAKPGAAVATAAPSVEAATKAATPAEAVIDDALMKGLKAEGVSFQGLEGFVEGAQSAAAKVSAKPRGAEGFYESLQSYYDEIKKATETVHIKDLEKQAAKLGITVDDLKALGMEEQLAPAHIIAYLKALDDPIKEWVKTAKDGLAGNRDLFGPFRRMTQEIFSYSPKFRSAQHISGLAVKVQDMDPRMKSITNMMTGWTPEQMSKLDLDAATIAMMEDVVALSDDVAKLKVLQLKAAQEAEVGTPTFWRKVKEGFSGLLLMRPVTWTRQFLGNGIATGVYLAEKELGGWLSIDQAKGLVKHEGFAQMKAMQMSVGEAIKGLTGAFKTPSPDLGRLDIQVHQIGGNVGRVLNIGHDMVRGLDNFVKILGRNSEIYAQAYRAAVHRGLEPGTKKFTDYVLAKRMLPTAEMTEVAESVGLHLGFQQELGTWGKATQKFLQYGPLYFWFPYMKSPLNLVKWGWNHTPGLQLLSKSLYEDILAGGARADMAVARLTLSTIFGEFVFSLAQESRITGGGPVDRGLRRSWLATKQPYSLKAGDTWLPIQNTAEPGTTPVEMIADFAEIRNQLDEMTAEQMGTAIVMTLARDILDNTWWRSMGELVDITAAIKSGEEVGKAGASLLTAPVTAVLTGGPLAASIQRNIDPVRRETRTFLDNVRNGLFGYGGNPPMRDSYGDPILIPQALGGNWLRGKLGTVGDYAAGALAVGSPFLQRPEETDPIKKEGARLQARLPMFPWSLGGKARDDFDIRTAQPGDELPTPLTAQQRDRWQVIYRNILRHAEKDLDPAFRKELQDRGQSGLAMGIEKGLLNTPEYQNATPVAQRSMFMDFLANAREQAKWGMLVENPDLMESSLKNNAEKYLSWVNEAERPPLQNQINESLDALDSLLPDARDNLLKWGELGSGEERDQELIQGLRLEINKPIPELNAAAAQEGSMPAK